MATLDKKKIAAALVLSTAAIALGRRVAAQSAPGPFTGAQAEAGRATYIANCMSCHQANMAGEGDALPLVGRTFMAQWQNRPAKDLYDTIHASMPYGNPGSLDVTAYTNLVAFILQSNGAKAGTTAL